MPSVKIYVTLKEGILDVQGAVIQKALGTLGFDDVTDVKVGKYLKIEIAGGDDPGARIESMCRQLLTNPVIEDFTYEVTE